MCFVLCVAFRFKGMKLVSFLWSHMSLSWPWICFGLCANVLSLDLLVPRNQVDHGFPDHLLWTKSGKSAWRTFAWSYLFVFISNTICSTIVEFVVLQCAIKNVSPLFVRCLSVLLHLRFVYKCRSILICQMFAAASLWMANWCGGRRGWCSVGLALGRGGGASLRTDVRIVHFCFLFRVSKIRIIHVSFYWCLFNALLMYMCLSFYMCPSIVSRNSSKHLSGRQHAESLRFYGTAWHGMQ